MIKIMIYLLIGFVLSILYNVVIFIKENKKYPTSVNDYIEYDLCGDELLITMLMFVVWPLVVLIIGTIWLYEVVLKAILMLIKPHIERMNKR